MSLIVESGAGSSLSESYSSVTYADTYWSNRGCAPWATLTTAQKEESLRRATDYIEQVYGQSFQGYRINYTQALSFPRAGVVVYGYDLSSSVIPELLIKANAELAYKAAQGNLSPDLTQTVVREKVDVLEVEYAKGSSSIVRYRAIDNLLSPLLTMVPNGAFHKLVRA